MWTQYLSLSFCAIAAVVGVASGQETAELVTGPCRRKVRNVDFQGIAHGEFVGEFNGVKIQAFPRSNGLDSPCYTGDNNEARVIVTGNPLFKCVPGQGNPALGSSVGRAIVIQQGPDAPTTRCVDDCSSGGEFVFTFPKQVKINKVQLVNMDIFAQPAQVIYTSKDANGRDATTVVTMGVDSNNNFAEERINAEAYEMKVIFTAGGAVSNVQYEYCDSENRNDSDPNCQQLVRNYDIDNMGQNPFNDWMGNKHDLDLYEKGIDSPTSLKSKPRPRTFLGPQQTLDRQARRCVNPGSVYKLSSFVQLRDPSKNNQGAFCQVNGPIVARDRKNGDGLCPGFLLKIRDGQGRIQFVNLRIYRSGSWKANDWNLLEGNFVAPPVGPNWDGEITLLRLRVSGMDPNLSLVVDKFKMERQ